MRGETVSTGETILAKTWRGELCILGLLALLV